MSVAEDEVLTYAENKLKQNGGGRISKKRPPPVGFVHPMLAKPAKPAPLVVGNLY